MNNVLNGKVLMVHLITELIIMILYKNEPISS